MDSFEINKIIASILLTALIIIGIGKIVDILFYIEKPKMSAYKIEGIDQNVSGKEVSAKADKVVEAVDNKTLLAMGDMAHGEKVFKKCSACHMIAADGKNKIGPNLWSVIGRTAGAINDYNYSKALRRSSIIWNEETIAELFRVGPDKYLPGTKMPLQRITNKTDIKNLVRYLKTITSETIRSLLVTLLVTLLVLTQYQLSLYFPSSFILLFGKVNFAFFLEISFLLLQYISL